MPRAEHVRAFSPTAQLSPAREARIRRSIAGFLIGPSLAVFDVAQD
jgi:hypothetical protein